MFTVGINQFIRNIRRNLLTILQLVIVYIIAIFTVSACVEQLTLYRGVSDFIDETGMVLWRSKFDNDLDLKKELVKVEYVEKRYTIEMSADLYSGPYYAMVSFSDEVNHYQPPLMAGQWCDSGKAKEGVIRAVVSDDFKPKCKVGDKVEIDGYTLLITGIYSRNELIYSERTHSGKPNYLEWYNSAVIFSEEVHRYQVFASYEDMHREGRPYSMYSIIIDYEDDITEEEMEYNKEILEDKYKYIMLADMVYAKDVYDTSIQLLEIKLVPMVVIFLVALVFAVVSMMVSGSITVYAEQRNYGIYFLYGNSWKKTILLSVIHWALASVVALIVSVCACVIAKSVGIVEDYALFFSQYHVYVLLLITVFLMLMAIVLPYGILKKMQPINIIRNNM